MKKNNIGLVLKDLRLTNNLSQEYVANMLDLSRSMIAQIETGKSDPKLSTLKKITNVFDVSLDYLLNGGNNNEPKTFVEDFDKFENILLYILTQCAAKPNVSKSVLYRILYFIDLEYYSTNRGTISGLKYVKLENGPVPHRFDHLIQKLIDRNVLIPLVAKYYNRYQFRLIPNKRVEMSKIKHDEKGVIDKIITTYSDLNTSEINHISQKNSIWTEALSYEPSFETDTEISVGGMALA